MSSCGIGDIWWVRARLHGLSAREATWAGRAQGDIWWVREWQRGRVHDMHGVQHGEGTGWAPRGRARLRAVCTLVRRGISLGTSETCGAGGLVREWR